MRFLELASFNCSKAGKNGHMLLVEDVQFKYSSSNLTGVEVTFKSYKHSKGKSQTLFIACCSHECDQCPVHALHAYFCLRKPVQGPIFTFMDGSPISRAYFTKQLNLSLAYAGCPTTRYKGHSFRIGAATSAFSAGIAESKIQTMGRWSSNAYKRYIRIPMLSL